MKIEYIQNPSNTYNFFPAKFDSQLAVISLEYISSTNMETVFSEFERHILMHIEVTPILTPFLFYFVEKTKPFSKIEYHKSIWKHSSIDYPFENIGASFFETENTTVFWGIAPLKKVMLKPALHFLYDSPLSSMILLWKENPTTDKLSQMITYDGCGFSEINFPTVLQCICDNNGEIVCLFDTGEEGELVLIHKKDSSVF